MFFRCFNICLYVFALPQFMTLLLKREEEKKNLYDNLTPPKLKNSSRLMVPPVLQGLASLFPPLNSVGLCAVRQRLVHLASPAWNILKRTRAHLRMVQQDFKRTLSPSFRYTSSLNEILCRSLVTLKRWRYRFFVMAVLERKSNFNVYSLKSKQ